MKDFIIIGNMNAVTFKDIFPLLKENKMFAGYHFNKSMYFEMPDDYEKYHHIENGKKIGLVPAICWYTSFQIDKRKEKLPLSRKYEGNEKHYPKYDNYDAIEVSKTKNIPYDYDGVMGVPISFLDKYCPEQFEIVGLMSGAKGQGLINGNDGRAKFYVNGKGVYARVLIKLKK